MSWELRGANFTSCIVYPFSFKAWTPFLCASYLKGGLTWLKERDKKVNRAWDYLILLKTWDSVFIFGIFKVAHFLFTRKIDRAGGRLCQWSQPCTNVVNTCFCLHSSTFSSTNWNRSRIGFWTWRVFMNQFGEQGKFANL